MNLRARFSTLTFALLAAASVSAQTAPVTVFSSLDKNADGRLSTLEVKGRPDLYTEFDALDKDRDGYLTAVEFSTWSGNGKAAAPVDATTGPGGSGNAQHMPKTD